MQVQEIMTKNVISIKPGDSVLEACEKYSVHKVGSLVVKDNDLIVGILTERDVIESMIVTEGNPKQTKVQEIMSSNIKTIHALAPIEKAADIMKEEHIKKLPVVLNNEIVGIVTETDITNVIHAYSHSIDVLTQFYEDSRETLEKMMDDWGDILISLRKYKRLPEVNEEDITI